MTREVTPTDMISEMQVYSDDIRALLDDFRREQTEDSDEGNDQHITSATAALDSLNSALDSLVP